MLSIALALWGGRPQTPKFVILDMPIVCRLNKEFPVYAS